MSSSEQDTNRYTTLKSVGESMLGGGLLIDTIRELYSVSHKPSLEFYHALLVILSLCLIMELYVAIASIILALLNLHPKLAGGKRDEKKITSMKRANASVQGIAAILGLFILVKAGLLQGS